MRHTPSPSALAESGSAASGAGSRVSEKVLEAALRCFARAGVSRTSMDDIARAAGCSRATVYRHFKNKNSVVAGVIARESAKFFGELQRRLEEVRTFEELFVRCATTADEFIGGHRVIQVIMEGEPEILLPHLALEAPLVVKVSTQFLAPYVERLMLAGDIDRDDPEDVAEWVVRTILNFLVVPSLRFDLGSEDDMMRLASRLIAPSLRRSRLGLAGT